MAEPRQDEIDAEIETAMQTKARYGYTQPAVVVKSWIDEAQPSLGFFFAKDYCVGDMSQHRDGTRFQVLAIV